MQSGANYDVHKYGWYNISKTCQSHVEDMMKGYMCLKYFLFMTTFENLVILINIYTSLLSVIKGIVFTYTHKHSVSN